MPTFTVHTPPLRNGASPDPQRFAFVRDGFHFWAFLTGPFWFIAHRLWLVLLCYVVVVALISELLHLFIASEPAGFVIGLLLAILVGFEAGSLRRWTYARNGWTTAGVVVAEDQEEAERRFFAKWAERPRESPPSPQAPAAPTSGVTAPGASRDKGRDPGHGIIGLFPEPGGRS